MMVGAVVRVLTFVTVVFSPTVMHSQDSKKAPTGYATVRLAVLV